MLDRLRVHETKRIGKALDNKNIEPRFIVSANPWLNPTELVFHVIKNYVESQEPRRTEEGLIKVLSDKIRLLQEESLKKYFRDCLDFDFILKSGH